MILMLHRHIKILITQDKPIDVIFIDTSHQYDHTLSEIRQFTPLLSTNGIIMFHDSNVTPLFVSGRPAFWRLNDTIQLSCINPLGVAPAIRNYFGVSFDVSRYINTTFNKDESTYQLIHYPFCNGLTVIKKI